MSFVVRCGSQIPDRIRATGQQLYEQGRVSVSNVPPDGFLGSVTASNGEVHRVLIQRNERSPLRLDVACDCLYFQRGQPCTHLWSVLIELDARGASARVPGNGPIPLHKLPGREAIEAAIALVATTKTATKTPPARSAAGTAPASAAASSSGKPAAALSNVRTAAGVAGTPTAAGLGTNAVAAKSVPGKTNPASTANIAQIGVRALPEFAHRWRHQLKSMFEARQETQRRDAPTGFSGLVAGHEVWYVLDVEASRQLRCAVIGMFERFCSPNGQWSPLRALAVSQDSVRRVTNQDDRELVQLLLGPDLNSLTNMFSPVGQHGPSFLRWAPQLRSVGALIPSLYESVLPRLCATQRFVSATSARRDTNFTSEPTLSWDAETVWRYDVQVETQRMHGVWRLEGVLRRGERTYPLTGCQLLSECGLVAFGSTLARVEATSMAHWNAALGNANQLVVPFEDGGEFLSYLWSLPEDSRPRLPPELSWEQSDVMPIGRLTVHVIEAPRAKNRLAIRAQFVYEESDVDCDDSRSSIVDVPRKRIYRRNLEAERELTDKIESTELLTPEQDTQEGNRTQYVLETRKLEEFVDVARKAGWNVVADGHILRSLSSMRLSVTSGLDWFDLEGEIDFDGVKIALPSILASIKRGERYIKLGDGTYGMLAREWLDKFGQFAALSDLEGDALRFQPSQAMLLDAMLSAQEANTVDCDERFDTLRGKLRTVSSVQSHQPPETFQGKLREYQREGLGWLHFLQEIRCGGCLADDMGLGKTVQVLALLESRRLLHEKAPKNRKPSLVVVPRSLVFNWLEEASRFTPQLRVLNYTGPERGTLAEQLASCDVVVTTYGVLRRDIADLSTIKFDYAILDEAQAIKNATSQATKAARLINADHRLAMTGTPVENHLGELWSLCDFLNPGMLGASKSFQNLVKGTAKRGAEKPSNEGLQVLARALRPFILRRTKQQVLTELPERTQQTLYCEMEPAQRKVYDELRDHYRQLLSQKVDTTGLEKSKIYVLEALLRLRQVACHPALVSPDKATVPSAKMDLLLEQLEELIEENHKVLIFSQFTTLLSLARRELDERKMTYEYLDGQTTNRKRCVDRFQTDPDCRLFLISLKAGGQGLNLTAADYVFILDPWWNPAVEAQAIDRAYRMGQTRHVFAYRLICRDTVEEKILALQDSKRELAEAIVGEDNAILRNMTVDDLNLLLS